MEIKCTHRFVSILVLLIAINVFSQVMIGLQESMISVIYLVIQQVL